MTSDLDCEDLFGCDHEPETPIIENGTITSWLCRCGQQVKSKEEHAKEPDTRTKHTS
jgi:hypothetical protein